MVTPIGLYLHVPFCASKCPYCDFYSVTGADDALMDAYTDAVTREMARWRHAGAADTVYLGGGTPSVLGGTRVARLLEGAAGAFGIAAGAEITAEVNPGDDVAAFTREFAAAGGNRVSLGMQAASDEALRRLGRRHRFADVEAAVAACAGAGIGNVSLDLMLATPGQTPADVRAAVSACAALGGTHVSAYLLKVEPGTPFAAAGDALGAPDEDGAAALYLAACEALESAGLVQYEVSNFARAGRESRHNLKYWDSLPYIGIGPGAHSYIGGERRRYARDLPGFLRGEGDLPAEEAGDMPPGSREEYAMLRLRLTAGIAEAGFRARFGEGIPAGWRTRARRLPPGLAVCDDAGIRLTRRGLLVGNAVTLWLLGGVNA